MGEGVSIPDRDFSWFQRFIAGAGTRSWMTYVSIPDRDFSWFQQGVHSGVGWRYCFQSLIGILVDFNLKSAKALKKKGNFQSLIGILVDFNNPSRWTPLNPCAFQSLIGILVDFNHRFRSKDAGENPFSIPDRDFSWFQLWCCLRCHRATISQFFNPW